MTRGRVAFVLPSLHGGGAERAAIHIVNALEAARWERAMYLFRREGPYLPELSSEVALHAGSDDSRRGRWLHLRQFLRAWQPDIVVSFLSYFTVLTAARAAGIGSRVVFNQQTPMSAFLRDQDYPWRHGWRRTAFAAVARLGYAAADLIVATSRGVSDDLVASFGVARDKIRVVRNPVHLEAVRAAAVEPIDPAYAAEWHPPVIVAAGRLADAKNYPLMLDALAELRRRIPARLFILGSGEREAALREQIAAKGLQDAVVLCGFQPNPWKYIARADVFVLTSRYEGFGNVLVEAMACGVPVVATASPGTEDIVANGRDGLLVRAHTPEAVAAALERVLATPAFRASLSDEARRSAERFALDVVAREYDAVFREVLA